MMYYVCIICLLYMYMIYIYMLCYDKYYVYMRDDNNVYLYI